MSSSASAARGRRGEVLGEPVLRVGVVVVALDRSMPGRLVQRDCFEQRRVGVEDDAAMAELAGDTFEVVEQSTAETDATPVGVDPHPLDLAGRGVEALDAAAATPAASLRRMTNAPFGARIATGSATSASPGSKPIGNRSSSSAKYWPIAH